MYQIFRAHRDRMAKYERNSKLTYTLHELRSLLGVADKYEDWRNFKRIVLDKVKKEINAHTNIKMTFTTERAGRKVTGVIFNFSDKDRSRELASPKTPTLFSLKVDDLTRAQLFAHDLLLAYGVKDSIVLEMIAKVANNEFAGFEDWYFEEVLQFFESKTNQGDGPAKAGTLVTWFLKLRVFVQDDNAAKIMEKIQARKKSLRQQQSQAWDNRLIAKDMTWKQFEVWFAANGKKGK